MFAEKQSQIRSSSYFEETGPMRNPQHIPIDNDNGHAGAPHDNKPISKANDEAVWDAVHCGPFTVKFDPQLHPFQQADFPAPKGGSTHSGPVVTGEPGDRFDYEIVGPKSTNDPRIIINR
jgi:hypothetical protein